MLQKKNSTQRLDVVVAGLAVADILGKPVDFRRPPKPGNLQTLDSMTLTTGGNVSNVGIALAKLGFDVGVIGRVGDDTLGGFILNEYCRFGIAVTGMIVDRTAQTSSTFVGVGTDGERTFLHTRGCTSRFRVTDVMKNLPLVKRAKVFAFGYLGLLPEIEKDIPRLFRFVKMKSGANILLDTGGNPSRNPGLLKSILPYVDYFIPSFEEAVALTGRKTPEEIVKYLFKSGAPNIVGVKLGAKGCYIANHQDAEFIPGVRVKHVVDTTGAGDTFVAGFLAAIIKGFSPFAAARIANTVAAECVTSVGASTAIQPFWKYVRK